MDNIDEIADKCMIALKDIEKEKLQEGREYDTQVMVKNLQAGDLVWKVILPIGSRDRKFGKC